MSAPRVLLVDDHGAIREALRIMLESHGLVVVGEAADGETAVRNANALRPDVVLMDLRMPGMGGVAATREIHEQGLADVLVLTSFDEDELVFGAIRAGAAGFLLKTADAATLVDAVHRVAAGEGLLDPRVTRRALAALAGAGEGPVGLGGARGGERGEPGAPARAIPDAAGLTGRERDVLDGMALGRSNAELAETLGISVPTVKTHVSNVLAKLGARSRSHAVAIARGLDAGR
ncbi:response regulator transcription factor [Agromyces mediolanus]|jgi:DNA-binding NarL/FixJ family response regulator|uniref:response regulator transcription factor n=1 Tax=Agromyces mediolanus TaxID=41986 RepID=UPI001E3998C3|nr:response regulator transcription factor [Agromyces mediolanus]MCD1572397.1 response regulator transcription factor [Agromyces mediolanus]